MAILKTTLHDELSRFEIGDKSCALTFIDRLCRENNWSQDYAKRCFEEYKRFIYLAMISDLSVTPSDEVDQVWHLHLTYTRSYWTDLCQTILKTPLHHGPTKGGQSESKKYRFQYQATLEKYLEVFEESPPSDIWPNGHQRFDQADKFVRLNTSRYFVLKKPSKFSTSLIALPLFLTACANSNSGSIVTYLVLAIIAFLVLCIVFLILGHNKGTSDKYGKGTCGAGCSSGGGNNDNDGGSGCGGGGCGGCGG